MNSTIKELYENIRKDGGIYWTVLLNDGERYGVFDTKLGPTLEQGKTYEFTVVTKGQYKNILKAEPVVDVNEDIGLEAEPDFVKSTRIPLGATEEISIENPPRPQNPVSTPESNESRREKAIARSVALKSATTYLSELPGGYSHGEAEAVVSLAQRFEQYLKTGV